MSAARNPFTHIGRLRGGFAVALAYLFVLQGLLAPGASLAAHPAAAPSAMVLCDGDMAGGVDAQDHPAGQADVHTLCCALGCLPGSTSLAAPALPPSAGLTAWMPPVGVATPGEPPAGLAGPPRQWRPGSPGPRAPPSPIA